MDWADAGDDGGWDGYVARYRLDAAPRAEDLPAAVAAAEAMLAPAGERFVLMELTRLRSLTVSRDQATEDLELMAMAYADELADYPADAVREVLRDWPRSHRFWPSLAELVGPLNRIADPRKALLKALRRGYREPETSPDWIKPTAEEIAAAETLLRENGIAVVDGRVHHERPPEAEQSKLLTDDDRETMRVELAAFRARWAATEAAA